MVVAIVTIELHIPESNSLKHKRMILNSLKGRLRSRFNVSVAEIGGHDKWQRSTIAVCQVSPDRKFLDRSIGKLMSFTENFNGADVLKHETEII